MSVVIQFAVKPLVYDIVFPRLVWGITLYICISAHFLVGIFITFNKENYHVYCFM